MKKLFIALIAAAIIPAAAQASKMVPCQMNENVNFNVSFTGEINMPKDALGLYEDKIESVQKMAKEMDIEGLQVTSRSMSMNSNMRNGTVDDYRYNFNASFSLDSVEKAIEMMEALSKEGISTSMSSSSHRRGGC